MRIEDSSNWLSLSLLFLSQLVFKLKLWAIFYVASIILSGFIHSALIIFSVFVLYVALSSFRSQWAYFPTRICWCVRVVILYSCWSDCSVYNTRLQKSKLPDSFVKRFHPVDLRCKGRLTHLKICLTTFLCQAPLQAHYIPIFAANSNYWFDQTNPGLLTYIRPA